MSGEPCNRKTDCLSDSPEIPPFDCIAIGPDVEPTDAVVVESAVAVEVDQLRRSRPKQLQNHLPAALKTQTPIDTRQHPFERVLVGLKHPEASVDTPE